MKALVLSGGSGSRLRPLTHTRSKHLLPLLNRPILHHVLDNIAKSGLKEVILLHGTNGQEIKESVGDGHRWNINIKYVQQDQPLGLAHAVQIARDALGDEAFMMYLGDNILPEGVGSYLEDFKRTDPDAMVLLHPVDNPSAFGIAELQGERVIRLMEKPKDPPSNLALVGIYFFSPKIHAAIDRIKPSARGELEITDAIQNLLEQGYRVEARVIQGNWHDTGTPEELLNTSQSLLSQINPVNYGQIDSLSEIHGDISIGTGTIVERSKILGPVMIGEHCRIIEATLGPYTSVGNNVVILRSTVSRSILLDGCKIQTAGVLHDCLIGEGTILAGEEQQRSYRLFCGDHSRLILPRVR